MPERRDLTQEPGFPQLSNVMRRLSRRAGLDVPPHHLNQAAQHIYYGTSEGELPEDHPMLQRQEWQKLARAGSPLAPETEEGQTIFGVPASQVQQGMQRGRIGPGWTQDQLNERTKRRLQDPNRGSWMHIAKSLLSTGDDHKPAQGELAPGDKQDHEWLRDQELMDAFASGPYGQQHDEHERNERIAAAVSGGHGYQPSLSRIDEAIGKYDRAYANPDFAFGDYEGDPFGRSNHAKNAGLGQMIYATQSPDYLAGRALTPLNSVNQFLNRMTARNPTRQDPWIINNSMVNRKNSAIANLAGPVMDFAAGVGDSIGKGELLQDLKNSTVPSQALWTQAISPVLTEEASTPEERQAVKDRQSNAWIDVDSDISSDDYYRGKTGEYPSWAGSMVMSGASEPVDFTTLASLLLSGGTGAIPLRSIPVILGREALDEAKWGVPITGGINAAAGNMPSVGNLFTPGIEARTDLHEDDQANMTNAEHKQWLEEQQQHLNNKAEELRRQTKKARSMTQGQYQVPDIAPDGFTGAM